MNKYIYYNIYSINKNQSRNKKLILITVILTLLLLFHFLFPSNNNTHYSNEKQKVNRPKSFSTAANTNNLEANKIVPIKDSVNVGENLISILGNYLSTQDIIFLTNKSEKIYPLNRLIVGQPYVLYLRDNRLVSFEYEINDLEKIKVDVTNGDFDIKKLPIIYDIKPTFVEGTIDSSLFEAVEKSGEKDILAIKMADIFAWDIDFIRDIRSGDSFKIIVEKRYREGEFKGYGKILAAQFINQGITYNAFLYTTKSGRTDYFNENGIPLRKAFLKAPLKFTRISSRFTYHRYHPILKKVRPHLGIDYAAPTGTPIKTVGDGVVIKKAYDRAAGRYIKIRHPNGYETIYNHMSRFAKGIYVGKKVRQGEVIGYVGSSGYATGPHLDFRVKYYGKYINPLKIKSTPLKPLPKEELALFKEKISPYILALKKNDVTFIALHNPNQKTQLN